MNRREFDDLREKVRELERTIANFPVEWASVAARGGAGFCLITTIETGEDPDVFSFKVQEVKATNIDLGEFQTVGTEFKAYPMPGISAQWYLPFVGAERVLPYLVIGSRKHVFQMFIYEPKYPAPTNIDSSEC